MAFSLQNASIVVVSTSICVFVSSRSLPQYELPSSRLSRMELVGAKLLALNLIFPFLSEMAVLCAMMFLLPAVVPRGPVWLESLLDATGLSIIGSLALWRLVAEPVRQSADQAVRQSADYELPEVRAFVDFIAASERGGTR